VATISTLVSIAGVLLLLYLAYVSYYGTWGLPTKLQKAAAAMRKRMEGLPRSGAVSIMVTDIEGYSGESTHGEFRHCGVLQLSLQALRWLG
jgi:hypothetical protein